MAVSVDGGLRLSIGRPGNPPPQPFASFPVMNASAITRLQIRAGGMNTRAFARFSKRIVGGAPLWALALPYREWRFPTMVLLPLCCPCGCQRPHDS